MHSHSRAIALFIPMLVPAVRAARECTNDNSQYASLGAQASPNMPARC